MLKYLVVLNNKGIFSMNFNKKGLVRNLTLYLSGVYLLFFIVCYIKDFVFPQANFFFYLDIFLDKLISLLPPSISALIALIFSGFGKNKITPYAVMIPTSVSRIIYVLPYFYIKNILDGYISGKAFLYSAIYALADIFLNYLLSLIVYLVIRAVIRIRAGRIVSLPFYLKEKTELNVADPIACAFLTVSFIGFLYFFIAEIINTVSYIISYSFNFTSSDLILAVVSYIYIVFLLFVYFFTLAHIKNKILEKRLQI